MMCSLTKLYYTLMIWSLDFTMGVSGSKIRATINVFWAQIYTARGWSHAVITGFLEWHQTKPPFIIYYLVWERVLHPSRPVAVMSYADMQDTQVNKPKHRAGIINQNIYISQFCITRRWINSASIRSSTFYAFSYARHTQINKPQKRRAGIINQNIDRSQFCISRW